MNNRFRALLAVLSLPLCAQSTPPPDLGLELDEIIGSDQIQAASKKVQDVASAPADVVVLRSSQLRALGYRTLGDALGGVVGFRTNEDHAYQGLGVRGLYVLGDQNTRVLVLLDGHALNSPVEVGSSKVGEDFGLPIELVDRIEIVRGPASSLYGNSAFQALVNVVSVDAAQTRKSPFVAAATFGSRGTAELWLDGGMNFGGVAASLMASGFQRKGAEKQYPQLGEVNPDLQQGAIPVDADREERQSAYLRVSGEEWSLSAFTLSRVQRLASAPWGSLPGSNDNWYRNRRLAGEFKWEPRSESVRWMVRCFGDRNEFADAFAADPTRDNPDPLYDGDPDWSLGLELQGRAQMHERFSLTFGTEQRLHHFSGNTFPGADRITTAVNYRIGNTYLEGNWKASNFLSLVAGLQAAEWRPSRVIGSLNGEESNQEKDSIQRLTPRLSAIFTPSQGDVVKVIYGQGFRFPTIFERYYSDNVELLPNPKLQPEVLDSLQASWTRKWTPRFRSQVSASLFQWERQILSIALPLNPSAPDDPTQYQYQNAESKIRGKALEGEMAWRSGGNEIMGGIGWYDWTSAGTTLDNVAHWTGNLKAIHHWGPLSFGGEVRYISPRSESTMGTQVPANWTLRASFRYELTEAWFQLTVEDLTGSRRRDLVGTEYSPITWMDGGGAQVRASLGVRF